MGKTKAPWGYRKDGKPKKQPGVKKGSKWSAAMKKAQAKARRRK